MDYTTVGRVVAEAIKVQVSPNPDEALLQLLITSASRAIDRKVTGAASNDAMNYFEMADVANETGRAIIDRDGTLRYAPHKPVVNSIASMSYRFAPSREWLELDSDIFYPDGEFACAFGALAGNAPGKVFIQISYNGGLAEDVADLPADLIELATLLSARFYREAETGLSDAIGVAELGTLIYTKAWPVRFVEMLQPFVRVVPWRGF